MRLLVVGHTYLTVFAQRKYVEMKRQQPGLDLRILTPRAITHVFGRYMRQVIPEFAAGEMVNIREFFGRSHMSYVLNPFRFARLLREFRPDRIHIEEDPYSAVGVETVFLARLFCPSAKISFFIWDNLDRVPRFPLNVVKRTLNRYALRRAELVVCGNSEGERLLVENKGYRGRTAVLPQLGLEPERYADVVSDVRVGLGVPADVLLIGFVGRLLPEKGVLVLLEALRQLQDLDWRVLILGTGPLQQELSGKWRQLLGDRLICRSAVAHAEVPSYMRALDIFVLPSYATPTWKEQFGMVLAEAMMAGVPCVGACSGAIPEVIGPGGLVFRERDVDDLARALRCLLTEEALRESLGREAQAFARQRYANAALATAYLHQFGSV